MENTIVIEKKLDQLINLSLHSLVLTLYMNGHTMNEICKNLHMGKGTVVAMLAGLEKGKKA